MLPVAAAAPLRPLLTGPPVVARAALVGRQAAYLVVEGPGAVLAVAAPEAVAPPCAVVLPAGTDPRDVLPEGSRVAVGEGRLDVGTRALVVRRWWSPPVLPLGAPDPVALARAEPLVAATAPDRASPRGRALAAARPAATALAAGDVDKALAHLLPVLGLGPGSTPSGDDVTAAVLLGARACAAPLGAVEQVGATVSAAARAATTPVSAGLLAEAAAGRAMRPAVAVLRALLENRDVEDAVSRLLDLGHTSGADMAAGLCAAAAALCTTQNPASWRRTA